MHNMHPALESGAAIQDSHNVTPFLHYINPNQNNQRELYRIMFVIANWLKPVYLRLLLLIG